MIDFEMLKVYSKTDESLRNYQQENKQKVYDAWSAGRSVMLQMPTGTGKTRLFVSIIKDIFHFSRDTKRAIKVLVLVHRTELIDQIDEELSYRYELAHGIIQSGDKERKHYPIQLASVQTLNKRLDNWKEKAFDFIIVDEAHHVEAKSYQKIISAFPDALLLGVTATPVRLSGEGFTGTFDELIVSPSVRDFINEGYLSRYDYYSVARSSFIQKEIDGIKKFSNGDYAESEMERICDNDRIRAQVVNTYLDFANGKKGIVYTINKLHNKKLCEEFIQHGTKAVALDSDTPDNVREESIRKFCKGEYQVICNVNLFTEGFDCPDIEFIQLARPTKSLALYLQQVGRGLRISESKERTIFLDNVGLYNRFGFPSSRRMWKHHFEGKYLGNKTEEEVEGKKKTDADSLPKREYHQNLEEGIEEVHLIQSTEDREYLEERKKQLLTWCEKFSEAYIICANKANENIKSKTNPNIKLTIDFSHKCHAYKYVLVDLEEENLKTLAQQLDKELAKQVNSLIKPYLETLSKDFDSYHFSFDELSDIVINIINNKTCINITTDNEITLNVPFTWIVESCLIYSSYFGNYRAYIDLFYVYLDYLNKW